MKLDVIPLSGDMPGAEPEIEFESDEGDLMLRNVTAATLTPFWPDPAHATGDAVIVAPGGAFRMLSWDYEGLEVARWLAARGIAAFVLKYRLIDTGATHADFKSHMAVWFTEVMQAGALERSRRNSMEAEQSAVEDAVLAVRRVRENAPAWGVRTNRVGFLGFSAGAFLATRVAVAEARAERPDFIAAIYGGGVLGPVPSDAPPLFAVVAADDGICLEATVSTFQAWKDAGQPAELHVYERGGHGFGAKRRGLPVDDWMERFVEWLDARQ